MSYGPRAGFAELKIPENEPSSSIIPGKVNPAQAEALGSRWLRGDECLQTSDHLQHHSFHRDSHGWLHQLPQGFLSKGQPNLKKFKEYVDRSLMLVTALSPVIGYDKSSKIAHYALDNDLTLKDAAMKLGFVTEDEFDRVVDPAKMVHPYVAGNTSK